MKLKSFRTEQRTLALLDQGVVSGCNFLSVLYVGRNLAAEDFGLFSLALMAVLFLANLHRAIFTQPLNVLASGQPEALVAARTLALLRAHWLAIPAALALLLLAATFFFPDIGLVLASACYAACFFLQEVVRRYWYTVRRAEKALANDLLSYGGQLLLLLGAGALTALNGRLAFLLMACTSLLAFAFGVRAIVPARAQARATPVFVLRRHWPLARWLIPTVLTVWCAGQAYPFLMAALGPAAVAAFAASRNLLNAVGIVVQSVDNYLPVRAGAVLRNEGKHALGTHLLQTLIASAAGGTLFVLAMLALAEPLLHLLYKGNYDHAAGLLQILALGSFFALIGTVLGAYSLAMEDSRASFLANLGATAFTFTAGLWLIREYGAAGAAAGATLSAATAMLLQGLLVAVRFQSLPAARPVHASVGQHRAAYGRSGS